MSPGVIFPSGFLHLFKKGFRECHSDLSKSDIYIYIYARWKCPSSRSGGRLTWVHSNKTDLSLMSDSEVKFMWRNFQSCRNIPRSGTIVIDWFRMLSAYNKSLFFIFGNSFFWKWNIWTQICPPQWEPCYFISEMKAQRYDEDALSLSPSLSLPLSIYLLSRIIFKIVFFFYVHREDRLQQSPSCPQ